MSAILLVRHGQASFGMGDYDRLSDTGFEQARVLGQRFSASTGPIHIAVAGDLRRHRETAQTALQDLRETYETDPGWNEYDHVEVLSAYKARWANQALMKTEMVATLKPRQNFQAEFAQAIERWTGGQYDADYQESWNDFRERVYAALDRIHERLDSNQTAVVFTSGGPITAILQKLAGLSTQEAFKLNWTLSNASITKLLVTRGGLRLSTFNDHAHFEHAPEKLITYR